MVALKRLLLNSICIGLVGSAAQSVSFAQAQQRLENVPADLRNPPRAEFLKCYAKMAGREQFLTKAANDHTKACTDVPKGSAAAGDCANEKPRLDSEIRVYRADREKFNANLQSSVTAANRLADFERRLATTRTALKGNALRAGRLDGDIEQWVNLDEQVRKEAQVTALEVIKGHLLINLSEHVQSKVAAEVKADDRRSWIFPDFDGSPLQRLRAEGLQRLAAARTDRDVVKVLEWMDNGILSVLGGADASLRPRTMDKWADFVVTVSSSFVKDPLLGKIVADAKAVPVIVYGIGAQYTVKQRLEEIRKLGDLQYEDAKRYAVIYMQELQEVKRLRSSAELKSSRCPTALD
jgi:hypothetical protein